MNRTIATDCMKVTHNIGDTGRTHLNVVAYQFHNCLRHSRRNKCIEMAPRKCLRVRL